MYVFTCTDFEGYYPVGAAAVVVANNAEEAEQMLKEKLERMGLNNKEKLTMVHIHTLSPSVHILVDGNY